MFRVAGIIFAAAFFWAGCSSQPPRPPSTVEEAATNEAPRAFNWTNPRASGPLPYRQGEEPEAPVLHSNYPPPVAVAQTAPAKNFWMPLREWTAENHLGAPHRLTDLPVTAYAIGSKYGSMVLEIGSLEATWNGVIINLGFAPQWIDGEIYLDRLDMEKNLAPLLCGPPLTFGKDRVIVVDPGHGGSNTGTHSVLDGRFEKEFTLDLALRLKPLLEAGGWTVFLTRDSDAFVPNPGRVVFAREHHADLFISLHFNSAGTDTKQAGLETYCFTPTGMPSTVTRGYSDPWWERLTSNDFDRQNLQLAVKLQTALLHSIGMEDRGVRRARYIEVLRGQECPAVLIENGYLSNRAEAKLIESAGYRQRLAEAIAAALNGATNGMSKD